MIDASYKIDADKLRAIGRMGGPTTRALATDFRW